MDKSKIFKCLADENRLEIIRLLSGKKYCVRALSGRLGISESAVSQHIRLLKDAGIVETGDKNGYHIHYAVNKDTLKQLSQLIADMADSVQEDRECGGGCRKEKK